MARFERRHATIATCVQVLSVVPAVLGWTGQLSFENNVFTTIFTAVGLIGIFARTIIGQLSKWYAPIGFTLPLDYLPGDPATADGPCYRYVRPCRRPNASGLESSPENLNAFTSFSVQDQQIAGAHPELDPVRRKRLYSRWFAANPKAFMSLERRANRLSRWETIAVSIMLPLRPRARRQFCSGEVDVLGLNDYYIAGPEERSGDLLIDTLIIKPRYKARNEGYGFPGLLLRHLAEFWSGSPICLLVEPDSDKVSNKLLRPLKFLEPERPNCDSKLFEVHYPLDIYTGRVGLRYQQLIKNINAARSWKVHECV